MAYQDPRLEGAYQGAPIDSDSHQVGSLYPRDAGDASAHVADGAEPDRVGAQFQFVPTVMAVPENESPYAKALREFNEQQMMYDDAPRPKYQKEEEFLRLLLTIEGKALSKELFKFLFDLFINNCIQVTSAGWVGPEGRHLDFFYLFFELMHRGGCDIAFQVALLRKMNALLMNSTRLRTYCCSHDWSLRLIEMLATVDNNAFLAELVVLIKTLCSFSIRVKEMNAMFRLMNADRPTFSARDLSILLDVLQSISLRTTPTLFFDFRGPEGVRGALIFDILLKNNVRGWGNDGYSIAAWVRVEAFPEKTKAGGTPYLLCMLTPDLVAGVELYFSEGYLVMESRNSKSKKGAVKFPTKFQPGQWTFIMVSHTYHFIRRSEVSLFVDGKHVANQPLVYPKVDKPFECTYVGTNGRKENPQALQGQLGVFVVFGEPVSRPEEVSGVHALGSDMTPTTDTEKETVVTGQAGPVFLFEGKRKCKSFACYHPKSVFNGVHCVDTASMDRNRPAKLSMKEALSCTGGIKVLLPMLRQINPSAEVVERWRRSGTQDVALLDPNMTLQVYSLLETMLKNNPQNQEQMLRAKGFPLIGQVLMSSGGPPHACSGVTILRLEKLALAVSSSEPLYRSFFEHVYLNFGIWSHCDAAVQRELLASITKHVRKQPQYFRSLITVQRIMDILRTYYYFGDTAPPDSVRKEPKQLMISCEWGKTDMKQRGRRHHMSLEEVRELRVMILQLAKLIVVDGFSYSETKAVLAYLEDCRSEPTQCVDVLQMLLATLASTSPYNALASSSSSSTRRSEHMVHHILALGGAEPFISMMDCDHTMVRAWSLKTLGKLLELCEALAIPKERLLPCMAADDASPSASSVSSSRVASLAGTSAAGGLTAEEYLALVMKVKLTPFGFSEATYHSLLEVLLEHVSVGGVANPVRPDNDHIHFRNPAIGEFIFELLCSTASTTGVPAAFQLRVLRDFESLLQHQPNCAALLRRKNWQKLLVTLLASVRAHPSHSSERALIAACVRLLVLLFHHLIHHSNVGSAFSDLRVLLHHFQNIGLVDAVDVRRKLNEGLLNAISYDSTVRRDLARLGSTFVNVSEWLLFVEQSMFRFEKDSRDGAQGMHGHIMLGIHRRHDNMWLDFEFAQAILDYLDSVLATLTPQERPSAEGDTKAAMPQAVKEKQSQLMRFALRLTLYTLHETDAFLNTEKITERSQKLKAVETVVDHHFPGLRQTRVKDGLSLYLQGKMKQWNAEMSSVDGVFQKNIDRLRLLVRQLIRENDVLRVLHVVSFLFLAMRRSYETQGAELILRVFKEITVSVKGQLPLSEDMACMSQDQFVEVVMRHLSKQEVMKGEVFMCFDRGAESVLEEERQMISSHEQRLERDLQAMLDSIRAHDADESRIVDVVTSALNESADGRIIAERSRVSRYVADRLRTERKFEKLWRSTMRELCHERGPWAVDVSTSAESHWKLARNEGAYRQRIRLKRNHDFQDHKECARRYEADSSGGRPSGEVSPDDLVKVRVEAHQGDSIEDTPEAAADDEAEKIEELRRGDEEKCILRCECEFVKPMVLTQGQFELTTTAIYFIADAVQPETKPGKFPPPPFSRSHRFPIKAVHDVQTRRHLLRNNALEFFFSDGTTAFFTFKAKMRNKVWKKFMYLEPPFLASYHSTGSMAAITSIPTPSTLLKRLSLTERWRRHQISNFEYLMALNTLAGRTYNDLTQYPVFPWVLADYTSRHLDLSDPSVYRDLSKPIGALDPKSLESVVERFQLFDDPVIPKFHYGSHYSNVGSVLYYLVRLEPFTSYFLNFQGGKFDHPDRMFLSLEKCWANCLTNPSDVKELTPEFFYMPEFLVNKDNFVFGTRQNDEEVCCDVQLPPWASTAQEFVRIHRAALESDYVSANLHHWIDLIFGFKQQGQAAIDAHNVFFYLTYAGVVDLDSIDDEVQRSSIEQQIHNFGQTPLRLFSKPHPARCTVRELQKDSADGILNIPLESVYGPLGSRGVVQSWRSPQEQIDEAYEVALDLGGPVAAVAKVGDKCVVVSEDGLLTVNTVEAKPVNRGVAFAFDPDRTVGTKNQKTIDLCYSSKVKHFSSCHAVSADAKMLVSVGGWDDTILVHQLSSGKLLGRTQHHFGIVTCVTITALAGNTVLSGVSYGSSPASIVVTGSDDCTVAVWRLNTSSSSSSALDFLSLRWTSAKKKKALELVRMLHAHDDGVTCVAADAEIDIVLSGSKDCTVAMHSLAKGKYLRSLPHPSSVDFVTLCKSGVFAVACLGHHMLYVYDCNGQLLGKAKSVLKQLRCIALTRDGGLCITAGSHSSVIVRATSSPMLPIIHYFEMGGEETTVLSLQLVLQDHFICVGLSNGRVRLLPLRPYSW